MFKCEQKERQQYSHHKNGHRKNTEARSSYVGYITSEILNSPHLQKFQKYSLVQTANESDFLTDGN